MIETSQHDDSESFPYLKQGAVVMINAADEAAFVDDVLRSIAFEYNWPSYSVKLKQQ